MKIYSLFVTLYSLSLFWDVAQCFSWTDLSLLLGNISEEWERLKNHKERVNFAQILFLFSSATSFCFNLVSIFLMIYMLFNLVVLHDLHGHVPVMHLRGFPGKKKHFFYVSTFFTFVKCINQLILLQEITVHRRLDQKLERTRANSHAQGPYKSKGNAQSGPFVQLFLHRSRRCSGLPLNISCFCHICFHKI